MAKSKADYFAMGQKDFIGVTKHKNRYALARFASYAGIDSNDSWQGRAYYAGYQAGARVYWDSLAVVAAQLRAKRPIHECLSLDSVDRAISSGMDLSGIAQTIADMSDALKIAERSGLVSANRARAEYLRNRAWSENALDVRAFHAFALTDDKGDFNIARETANELREILTECPGDITDARLAFRAMYSTRRLLGQR